jgi:multidrug efflux pump
MFSRFFIERPVFAAVVSIIIVLAGLVAMRALPVEQYPTIIPVQVTVQTTYPGADSQTLAESVAAPIEAQINGVDNMLYMTSSSSSTGQLTLTVFFSLDTDPDIAQVQVQNRVNLALPQLPEAVTQNGVQVQKKSSSIMMLIAVKGPAERYTPEYIANYANVYVLDTLKRVPGAGQAQIFGVPDQAMRIWMNPDRMASLGITTSDIQQAVQAQNALFGAGQIGQQPTQAPVELSFPVVTQRPFTDPLQYENMILRAASSGSAIVRLKDVARAEVGLKSYIVDSKLNGVPSTYIAVYQQAGSNAIAVSDGVRRTLEAMQARMPPGIETVIALDTTDFVRLSIEEVVHTLFEALALVVLVVFLFLQSLRATFICIVAIIVALVGAFTGMFALGYSLNLLTLFGLVLAIGMVVDDAIVVVENTDRNMHEHGLGPKEAAIRSMEEVSGPVIAVVLVLCAVFIPAAFLPGSTGQLYKQFAITIVVSVAISGFVALTLTPAMCALLLKHEPPKTKGFFGWFNRQFQKLTDAYGRLVMLTIRRAVISLVLLVGFIAAIVWLFRTTPTSFVPLEDQGYVLTAIVMPDAASLDRTVKMGDAVDKIYAEQPGVLNRSVINGYSLIDQGFKTNASTLFITLKDFKERYKSLETAKLENPRTILIDVYKKSFAINEALVLPIPPPAIPGLGATGGFEFWIQSVGGGDATQLDLLTQQFLKAAKARPELASLSTTFRANSQQLKVDVDRDKATLLGVQISDVYSAIQAQFGSLIVSQFNQYSRSWFVILQSDARFRLTPEDITKLYTRNQHGQMIPLTALVRTSYVTGPDLLPHFNGFPAAKIIGSQAPGYSSGQAIAAMEEVARDILPGGYQHAWSGIAYDEKQSGGTSMVAFVFGLIFVFLVLAAQYESWTLPGAVMTAVPFGVLGALVFNWMRGLDNDVYFQIGLLVLIGLGAKNAVLRVSAAVELRQQGKSIIEATMLAGERRLRPIVMTSLAFAFGVLPLALALGAGANARHSIGTGIIGGMLGETTLAMLYVPLFYYLFARFKEWRAERKAGPGVAPVAAPNGGSE